jgi:hypothetical protein
VALDDLCGAHPRALRDFEEIQPQALVVAGGDAPAPAAAAGGLEPVQHRRQPPPELGLRQPHRIVVHHQRAKRRHHLDDAGDSGIAEPVRQRHDQPAQVLVDAVAELDDQRRVAAGKEANVRRYGLDLARHRLDLGLSLLRLRGVLASSTRHSCSVRATSLLRSGSTIVLAFALRWGVAAPRNIVRSSYR